MDTLSSSVSTINVPTLQYSKSREFYHLKNPNTSHLPPHSNLSSKPNSNISYKPFTSPLILSSSQTLPSKPSSNFHKRPATGYAAALLDMAQCKGSLQEVQKDVQRFSKLLKNNQIQGVLKEVAKEGGFNRLLLALLKMLVQKGKAGMVEEVLEEFERIYRELCGTTEMVLV